MPRSMPSVRLLSGLTLLAAFLSPGLAGPPLRAPAGQQLYPQANSAAMQARLGLTPDLLKGARLYFYPEILAQTLADRSPDAQEVHTYLRDPVAWQKNMNKAKAVELGLPEFRLVLAN